MPWCPTVSLPWRTTSQRSRPDPPQVRSLLPSKFETNSHNSKSISKTWTPRSDCSKLPNSQQTHPQTVSRYCVDRISWKLTSNASKSATVVQRLLTRETLPVLLLLVKRLSRRSTQGSRNTVKAMLLGGTPIM